MTVQKTAGEGLDDLYRTKASLEALLNKRKDELEQFQNYMRQQLQAGVISLLNPSHRKMRVTYNNMLTSIIRLECRMRQRNIFCLNETMRQLTAEIKDAEAIAKNHGQ